MPPNVIIFFTDQQRWDTTGLHGNPLGLTLNFDRLAMQGTHLAQQSVVVVSQIFSMDKSQLGEYIGALSRERITQILAGIQLLIEPRSVD